MAALAHITPESRPVGTRTGNPTALSPAKGVSSLIEIRVFRLSVKREVP
jgi:hypothetical protein